jgi:hypothetical protein
MSSIREIRTLGVLRLSCFAVSGGASVFFGFLVLSPRAVADATRYAGYWIILAASILFAVALWHESKKIEWRLRLRPKEIRGGIFVLVVGVLLLVHEPFAYKILDDEAGLAATSFYAHLHKQILTPMRAHDLGGVFTLLDGYLDKRPIFFPFLVSLVHDVTGYRSENLFFVNALLLFVFLGLLWCWGNQIAGSGAGVTLVLLMGGLPLLANTATGGGFDLLNLVMIMASLLLGIRFLRERTHGAMSAFTMAIVLLAQTRYESALFVLAAGLVFLIVWIQERRAFVSWTVVAAPLLLLPYAWQHRMFGQLEDYWQLPEHLDKPFSIDYLSANFGHALNFFFDTSFVLQNSLLLSALGSIAPIVVAVRLARRISLLADPLLAPSIIFCSVIFVNFFVLLCYHWGQIDAYEAARLSLPIHLSMALGIVIALSLLKVPERAWRAIAFLSSIFLLGYSLPTAASHVGHQGYMPAREAGHVRSFIRENADRKFFYIVRAPVVPIAEKAPCISHSRARHRAAALRLHLERGTYEDILVFQRINVDPTGVELIIDDQDLGSAFELEVLEEWFFSASHMLRMSRLRAIDIDAPRSEEAIPPEILWGVGLP